MDQNKDWKPMAALVLAGLALFIALSGNRGYGNDGSNGVPQQIIVQPAAPAAPSAGGITPPVVTMPGGQTFGAHAWGGWRGGGFSILPLLFLAGLIFVAFRVIGRGRRGWGGHGWYGGPPWGGPGPGPQGPYGQYPPQNPQSQGQPYSGYPQGPQYQQGPQGQQGQPYQQPYQQPQNPQQGQQGQQVDAQEDITRPEGSGDY